MNETRKERIQKHFRDHKEAYLAAGAGAALGVLGTLAFGRTADVQAVQKIIGLLNWKPAQTLVQTTLLVRRGHPGFVIKCNETGEVFASQNRAAEAMKLDPRSIARNVQGKQAHVKGYTFQNMGEAK